ncbi:hypothetical protein [Bacillus sp. NPDC077027]|uniref:hypothetical protein n=1 Tax=Bacillus sp. NPDC077027 TaxID=3390548 RepID=UPI003D0379B5
MNNQANHYHDANPYHTYENVYTVNHEHVHAPNLHHPNAHHHHHHDKHDKHGVHNHPHYAHYHQVGKPVDPFYSHHMTSPYYGPGFSYGASPYDPYGATFSVPPSGGVVTTQHGAFTGGFHGSGAVGGFHGFSAPSSHAGRYF